MHMYVILFIHMCVCVHYKAANYQQEWYNYIFFNDKRGHIEIRKKVVGFSKNGRPCHSVTAADMHVNNAVYIRPTVPLIANVLKIHGILKNTTTILTIQL